MGSGAADLGRKTCDSIEANGGSGIAVVRDFDFKAIGETCKGDFQMRAIFWQMFESFHARADDGGLHSGGGVATQSGDISEITDHASGGCRQAGISIHEQVEGLGLSGHGW
jgi:hypothetical protein